MNRFFRILSIVFAALLAVHMSGCESSDDSSEVPAAVLMSSNPPDGEIPANGTITLAFDRTPIDITVNASTGKISKTVISGKIVTIRGPFTEGELALTITWADGEQRFNYTVTAPDPGLATDTKVPIKEPEPTPPPTKSPINVTDKNFTKRVIESELPVVVYFWADWCPPCQWMAPIIKEVAAENQETFRLAKLDVDRNGQAVHKYRIDAIPTFIVFKDGKIKGRFIGGMHKAGLLLQIHKAINAQGN